MALVSLRPHFIAPAMALCNLQLCINTQHGMFLSINVYLPQALKPLLEVVSVSVSVCVCVSLSLPQPNSSSVHEINGFKLETIIRGEGK